jgi:hypothetical protein
MPTYYISPSGNTANDGLSESNPWPFAKLTEFLPQPGDAIRLQGGATFPGSIDWSWKGVGDPAKPITLGSYGTGRATIASPPEAGAFAYAGPGGIHLQDLILRGKCARHGACGAAFGPVTDGDLSSVRLDRVEISGFGFAGVYLCGLSLDRPAKYVGLADCVLHHNGMATYLWSCAGLMLSNVDAHSNDAYPGNPGNAGGLFLFNCQDSLLTACHAWKNGRLSHGACGPAGIFISGCDRTLASNCSGIDNGDAAELDGQNIICYGGRDNVVDGCLAAGGLVGICLFHDQWSDGPVERTRVLNSVARGNVTDLSIVGDVFDSSFERNRVVTTGYKSVDIADSDGTVRRNVRFVGNEIEAHAGKFLLEAVPGLAGVEGLEANLWHAPEATPFLVRGRGYAKIQDALAAEPAGV